MEPAASASTPVATPTAPAPCGVDLAATPGADAGYALPAHGLGLMLSGENWSATVIDRLVLVQIDVTPSPQTGQVEPATPSTRNVRWLVRKLPAPIAATPGNPELRAFIEGVVQ